MWFGHKRYLSDFSSEVQAHIALEVDRLRAEGLTEEEACRQARLAFGNLTQAEERFHDTQTILWLDHLKQDIAYGIRQLAINKVFTTLAILTLALGIGSTSAIFTLIDTTLLRPLPYRNGDRIVHITDVRLRGRSTGGLVGVPRFFDLEARSKSYDSLGFYFSDKPTLIAGSAPPVPLYAEGVNANFWNAIGIRPLLGRVFTQADDRPKAPLVVVISYDTWQQVFAGDRSAVNRPVQIDGRSATIVGVLPSDGQFPAKTDIWTPAQFDPAAWTSRGEGSRFVNVIGRLGENVSLDSAQRELQWIGKRLQSEYPNSDAAWQFSSEPLRTFIYGSVRPALLLLMAASGLLLLIACINVASLLLSRNTTRAHEMSIREALGASRMRLLAQFLTENTLLALLGGALGLLCTFVCIRIFGPHLPGRLGTSDIHVNWPVLCFTIAISVMTGIVFGCVPVLRSQKWDVHTTLKESSRRLTSAGGARLRTAFITIQVAISLILLIGASLLAESLWNLINSPLGFQPDHVLTFTIKLPWNSKPKVAQRFFDDIRARLEAIPGVIAVGHVSALPTVDWHLRSSFDVDWKPATPHGDAVNVEDRAIGGSYFAAMRIPIVAGRYITESDRQAKQQRAVVNEQFVRQYGPVGNPIGHHLLNKFGQYEIIGVVGNIRGTAGSIAAPPSPEFYFITDASDPGRTFVIRSKQRPDHLAKAILTQVHAVDPSQAVRDMATLDELLDSSVAQPRFNMGLLSAFAIAATILACIGIYGVVSYSVNQRALEAGIRLALGATPQRLTVGFMQRPISAAVTGLAAGSILAVFLGGLLKTQLYGAPPNHLLTIAGAALVLFVPVLLASAVPAIRVARRNPVESLRTE